MATSQDFYKPLDHLPVFGLLEGEEIKVLKGGYWVGKEPDKIEVIKEYPNFILLRYFYQCGNEVITYRKCLNKVFLISGDASFKKV